MHQTVNKAIKDRPQRHMGWTVAALRPFIAALNVKEDLMYSEEDIKPIDLKSAIIKRPEMYFGSRGINAPAIASSISEGAIILGASKAQTYHLQGWWYVCADIDWLNQPSSNPEATEEAIFQTIWGFPEYGINSFRWEALARVFSTCSFTYSSNGIRLVSGNESSLPNTEIENIKTQGWARAIGFKFNKSV